MSAKHAHPDQASRVFDVEEQRLVDSAFAIARVEAPKDAAVLADKLVQLQTLHSLLQASPSLRSIRQLAEQYRDEHTLVSHLTRLDGLSGDLELPFKSTLSRTFLLAKIQFLRALVRTTALLGVSSERAAELCPHLREEFAQSIYTLLAEELLLALLRKPDVCARTKQRAADQLIAIWDNAALEIDDFCPLLESAWHARNRITAELGCLLGTNEYFKLVREDCGPQFLDFFSRDEVSKAEERAFQEFLFNMTSEEIETVTETMREQGLDSISPRWAGDVIGRPIDDLDQSGQIDPMALYRSYYRRQLAADFRIIAGSEGPRRTAEAYLMVYLLNQRDTVDMAIPPEP